VHDLWSKHAFTDVKTVLTTLHATGDKSTPVTLGKDENIGEPMPPPTLMSSFSNEQNQIPL
jgi:hypothetical protein